MNIKQNLQSALDKFQGANHKITQSPLTTSREPHPVILTVEESAAFYSQLGILSVLIQANIDLINKFQGQGIAPGLFQEGHLRFEVQLYKDIGFLAEDGQIVLPERFFADYAMIGQLVNEASRENDNGNV